MVLRPYRKMVSILRYAEKSFYAFFIAVTFQYLKRRPFHMICAYQLLAVVLLDVSFLPWLINTCLHLVHTVRIRQLDLHKVIQVLSPIEHILRNDFKQC